MSAVLDWISGILILGGATMSFTAAIAMARFPDSLSRMHAATKPQVVGLLIVLLGAGINLYGRGNVLMLVLAGMFTMATAPVIAHLLGRTAYREQRHRDGLLRVNELGKTLDGPEQLP